VVSSNGFTLAWIYSLDGIARSADRRSSRTAKRWRWLRRLLGSRKSDEPELVTGALPVQCA
jgi:hypothetical protein